MKVKIPFGGKVALKDGKIFALVFEQSLTEKQHKYLGDWWGQNYLALIREYERDYNKWVKLRIALIPCRSGSKRVPNKNILRLNGHPLLAFSVQAAKDSGIFDGIYASTDSPEIGQIAERYGAKFIHCPLTIAHNDLDSDIKWVKHALSVVKCDVFSILRPTSPFRTGATIRRAWQTFSEFPMPSSIRAVERCKQHPYKMWEIKYNRLEPLTKESEVGQLFNTPYQSLPEVYVQNASLEISWSDNVILNDSISGSNIRPFFTRGYEGFDINNFMDIREAEYLVSQGVEMPKPKAVR